MRIVLALLITEMILGGNLVQGRPTQEPRLPGSLEKLVQEAAGLDAASCGQLGTGSTEQSMNEALACGLESARRGKAFWIVRLQPGGLNGSQIADGLIGQADGTISLFLSTTREVGSSWSAKLCRAPRVNVIGTRSRFECAPPAAVDAPAGPPVMADGKSVLIPRRLKDVKPVYPKEAQRHGVEGRVIVETTIGSDGRVKEAKVVRSIPMLDAAALEAVRQWQFVPPTKTDGSPIAVIAYLTVDFSLNK